jgi:hypothetical protein
MQRLTEVLTQLQAQRFHRSDINTDELVREAEQIKRATTNDIFPKREAMQ